MFFLFRFFGFDEFDYEIMNVYGKMKERRMKLREIFFEFAFIDDGVV